MSPEQIMKNAIQKRNELLASNALPIIDQTVMEDDDMLDYGIEYDPLEDVVDEHDIFTLKESYDDP